MNANEDTHAIFNQFNGIELTLLGSYPRWFKRSGVVILDNKTRILRGQKRDGGRWGVVPASQHQEILVALTSLIRVQRYEMALAILDDELKR